MTRARRGIEFNDRVGRDVKGANLQLIKIPTDDEKADIALQKKDNIGTLSLKEKARFPARGARDGESE